MMVWIDLAISFSRSQCAAFRTSSLLQRRLGTCLGSDQTRPYCSSITKIPPLSVPPINFPTQICAVSVGMCPFLLFCTQKLLLVSLVCQLCDGGRQPITGISAVAAHTTSCRLLLASVRSAIKSIGVSGKSR
jgi:hypothetical protein